MREDTCQGSPLSYSGIRNLPRLALRRPVPDLGIWEFQIAIIVARKTVDCCRSAPMEVDLLGIFTHIFS